MLTLVLAFTITLVLATASTAARDPLPGKTARTIVATWAGDRGVPPRIQAAHPRGRSHDGRRRIRRMTIAAVTLILVLAVAASAVAAGANLKTRTAQKIVATWNCEDKLPRPHTRAYSPWKPHSVGFRRAQLNLWTKRLAACRAVLQERERQWNWQQWLPDKWRRIGVCETQLNWQHYNSSYEGAFGFATSSWDAFKPAGYPDHASQATPWQQYQVALNIYNRYGFSGWGCRNA